jgi:hypothetical protein
MEHILLACDHDKYKAGSGGLNFNSPSLVLKHTVIAYNDANSMTFTACFAAIFSLIISLQTKGNCSKLHVLHRDVIARGPFMKTTATILLMRTENAIKGDGPLKSSQVP